MNSKILIFVIAIIVILIIGVGFYFLQLFSKSDKNYSPTGNNEITPVTLPNNSSTSITPSPNPSLNPSPTPTKPVAAGEVKFNLYTRVTSTTWSDLQPFARDEDLYWGNANIPSNMAALTFPSFSVLTTKGSDDTLKSYAAINLDGEYSDYHQAYVEAGQIRSFVDQYNSRHLKDRAKPLQFVAFYHLNIIDSYPDIVKYPDVVLVGKSFWSASNVKTNSSKYISLIKQAGKTPVILLGDSKTNFSSDEVLANFHSVIDPAPSGLGLSAVGFYYPQNSDSSLFDTISRLR